MTFSKENSYRYLSFKLRCLLSLVYRALLLKEIIIGYNHYALFNNSNLLCKYTNRRSPLPIHWASVPHSQQHGPGPSRRSNPERTQIKATNKIRAWRAVKIKAKELMSCNSWFVNNKDMITLIIQIWSKLFYMVSREWLDFSVLRKETFHFGSFHLITNPPYNSLWILITVFISGWGTSIFVRGGVFLPFCGLPLWLWGYQTPALCSTGCHSGISLQWSPPPPQF